MPPANEAADASIEGFLAATLLPDSALLPPPPAAGSAAQQADDEAAGNAAGAPSKARATAVADARLDWARIAGSFSAIAGVDLAAPAMANTALLLRRAAEDAARSTAAAKQRYRRTRPFVALGTASCRPERDDALRNDGSYPSGNAATGWLVALLLTELDPQNADRYLKRGYEIGESRVVCLAHWKSDVEAGRLIAAATFARLHADPAFQAELQRAKAEMGSARASE